MKIAVIGARGIPANSGEIERYCQELYPQIVARGHEVDLYVQPSSHQQSWFSAFTYRRMKIITLPALPGKQLRLFNSALNTIWATFGKYDVIHIHGIAAAFSNSSIVVTCHRLESMENWWYKTFCWLLPWIEKIAVYYADEIIVTNQELSGYFFRKYGVCPHYIANAPAKYTVNRSHFSCRQAFGLEHQRYLIYLGTFEPHQRLDLLIKAFQKLQPPNWKLVLAGDISQSFQHTIDLLQMVRQQENIIFTGEIKGNFLAELMRGADLFINPAEENSLNSSVGMLEAMREGIPIVASDTATHRQLIGRDRGLLFRAGKFDSLLYQLEYAMSRPHLLQTMAKKAQIYIAVNHNWDKVVYKNLFLYLQLTTKIPLGSPSCQTFDDQ